jgi:hypothetical protein
VLRNIGGPWALASIWALTAVPAGFCVYILRTAYSERWQATGVAVFVESWAGTAAIWLVVTIALTVWGLDAVRRRG